MLTFRPFQSTVSILNKVLDITYDIDYDQIIPKTETLQEIIILTLSNSFGSKPKRTVGLVPVDFKYLTVAVVKGK